jgi:hypothetical protein
MDNLKDIVMYAEIWIITSIVTMLLWNKFVDHDDENNWPEP